MSPCSDVPTTIEAGLQADSVYPFYSGLFLPAKTPRDIVEKLHAEAAKAIQSPAVQERFAKLGVEPMPMTLDSSPSSSAKTLRRRGAGEGGEHPEAIAARFMLLTLRSLPRRATRSWP